MAWTLPYFTRLFQFYIQLNSVLCLFYFKFLNIRNRINFSRDGGYLCASSNKGTVHVFNLQDQHFNRQIKLAHLGFNSTNLFEAQYSMCNFQIPCELPCICAFGDNCNSVLCICVNGSYYKYMFTNDGRTCTRDSYENFLDLSLGSDF